MRQATNYAIKAECHLSYPDAVAKTREELVKEGFGVLTEIDVKETLKNKIDVDFRPYVILGACNPALAHQALTEELDIGLLLPCNVVVYATDDPNRCSVAAIDPVAQLGITGRQEIKALATQVRERLERVILAMRA